MPITWVLLKNPTVTSTRTTQVTHDVKERLENLQNELESTELTPEEQEANIKAEKMRIALEKMKAASFQKVWLIIFCQRITPKVT